MWERDPDEWGTGVLALLVGHRRSATRSPTSSSTGTSPRSRPATTRARKIAKAEVLREIAASVGLDPDAVAAEVASGRPLKILADEHTDAVKRWDDVRRPDLRRRRAGRVRPVHGPQESRRRRPRASTCSTGPTSTSSSTPAFRGRRDRRAQPLPNPSVSDHRQRLGPAPWRRADVGLRSDHVGGREGPRASLRLLQPHDPRARPDDDRIAATRSPGRSPRSPACGSGSSARRCGSCRPSSPTTRRSISTRTCDVRRGRRRPATTARCSTSADRSPSSRSTGARPLWEFTLIDGLAGGRAALLQKVHHTITDGVGGLRLSLALVDFEPEDRPRPGRRAPGSTPTRRHGASPRSGRRGMRSSTRRARRRDGAPRRGCHRRVLMHPTASSRAERPTRPGSSARCTDRCSCTDAARSDVMPGRSLRRQLETYTLALPARARPRPASSGGSINDVYITGAGQRARPLPRAARELGRRAAPRDADQHAHARRRRRKPVRARARSSCRSSPSTIRPRSSTRSRAADSREGRNRDRRGRGARRFPHRAPHRVPRRDDARPDPHHRLRRHQSARQPAPAVHRGRPVHRELPVRSAHGNRRSTSRCSATATTCNLGLNIDPAAITDVDSFMADIADSFEAFLSVA